MTDEQLISGAQALLDLDARGALVPHGIGGHARTIIEGFLALSRRVPASGGELKGIAWSDLDYLMSIIDSAIEDGFDPDEDGPLLDQIRAELKAPTAASPIVAAPEGWRTVPVEPTDRMRAAGQWTISDNLTVSVCVENNMKAAAIYAAMLAAAPSIPEGKAEPRKAMTLNLTEAELDALEALAKKQDLSPQRVLIQGLRRYQLFIEGEPNLGPMLPPEGKAEPVALSAEGVNALADFAESKGWKTAAPIVRALAQFFSNPVQP